MHRKIVINLIDKMLKQFATCII